jgi:hypothetical protein
MAKVKYPIGNREGEHHCGASGHHRGSVHDPSSIHNPFIHQE